MLRKGIAISCLPKTFRDAISVASFLGAKFLWIDSLCIMQDSLDDWQEEASRMADVYRGSLCNIAASASAEARAGCLYERKSQIKPHPCIIRDAWGRQKNDILLYNDNYWDRMFDNDPLRQRAWVVQELLLSRRILHMGRSQISWECYESNACEEYPGGIPSFMENVMRKTSLEEMSLVPSKPSIHWKVTWTGVVYKYTSCCLTKPEDKLVALSGIAKIWQAASQDEYIAGLWRKGLATQLLWKAWDQDSPIFPTRDYRAPSWSWASVDGKIYIPTEVDAEGIQISIIDVTVQAVSADPTGMLAGGSIRLSGPLTTLEVWPNSANGDPWHCQFKNQKTQRIYLGCSSLECAQNLHCLMVQRPTLSSSLCRCLILKPTGKQKGQFRRWGYLQLDEIDEKCFEEKCHDWLEYEEFDGARNYTITII
jgi:hypothetical protein